MRPCEHELNGEFVTGLAAHYGAETIEANPLVALRVNDVAYTTCLCYGSSRPWSAQERAAARTALRNKPP